MKTYLQSLFTLFILLFCLLPALAEHPHVIDTANVLGDRRADLEKRLAGTQIYVETLRAIGPNDETAKDALRDYANAEVGRIICGQGTNAFGFLIVVTMESRQWRISEWPLGIVGAATIEKAGDAMVAQFHQHDFYGGFVAAANVLQPPPKESIVFIILLCMGIVFGGWLMVILGLLAYHAMRVKHEPKPKPDLNREKVGEELNHTQKRHAEEVFSRYSEAERIRLAQSCTGSPYYCHGCWNDSWLFYYLLLNENSLPPASTTVVENNYFSTPSPAPEATTSSYEPPTSSFDFSGSSGSDSSGGFSSDSSGGGGSIDSGSFSSDSSGGGGSW